MDILYIRGPVGRMVDLTRLASLSFSMPMYEYKEAEVSFRLSFINQRHSSFESYLLGWVGVGSFDLWM